MKTNFNQRERIIRALLTIVIGALGISSFFDDRLLNTALIGIAGVILLTAIANFCPIYRFLGINTAKSRKMTY